MNVDWVIDYGPSDSQEKRRRPQDRYANPLSHFRRLEHRRHQCEARTALRPRQRNGKNLVPLHGPRTTSPAAIPREPGPSGEPAGSSRNVRSDPLHAIDRLLGSERRRRSTRRLDLDDPGGAAPLSLGRHRLSCSCQGLNSSPEHGLQSRVLGFSSSGQFRSRTAPIRRSFSTTRQLELNGPTPCGGEETAPTRTCRPSRAGRTRRRARSRSPAERSLR